MTPAGENERSVWWRAATPVSASGAVACIELSGHPESVGGVLRDLGIDNPRVGDVAVRDLGGVDQGLVVRWSATYVQLMPHGGLFAVRALSERLAASGAKPAGNSAGVPEPAFYPEARDDHEVRVLSALARTHSPRAIDLLLDQPRRWRLFDRGDGPGPSEETGWMLDRLVDPPLVAAVGPSNIGKSSLTNALAHSHVSIVADERGTTRDHVGVMMNLDGLAVRFVDTPGIRADAPESEFRAAESAWRVLRHADLLLVCGDKDTPPVEPPGLLSADAGRLSVALRCDLGVPAAWNPDFTTSAATGEGIADLSRRIRGLLVPDAALDDPCPWRIGGLE